MAVLSTLNPLEISMDQLAFRGQANYQQDDTTHDPEYFGYSASIPSPPTLSISQCEDYALSTFNLFGDKLCNSLAEFETPGQFATTDEGNRLRPADGPPPTIVWYCSECNDGPKGNWQNVCHACNHQRCASCKTEET